MVLENFLKRREEIGGKVTLNKREVVLHGFLLYERECSVKE